MDIQDNAWKRHMQDLHDQQLSAQMQAHMSAQEQEEYGPSPEEMDWFYSEQGFGSQTPVSGVTVGGAGGTRRVSQTAKPRQRILTAEETEPPIGTVSPVDPYTPVTERGAAAIYQHGSWLGLTRAESMDLVARGREIGAVRDTKSAVAFMTKQTVGPEYEEYRNRFLAAGVSENYMSPAQWKLLPPHRQHRLANMIPVKDYMSDTGRVELPAGYVQRGNEPFAFPMKSITQASYLGLTPQGESITTFKPEKTEKRIQTLGAHETMRLSNLENAPEFLREGPLSPRPDNLRQVIRAALVLGGDVSGPGQGLIDVGGYASQMTTYDISRKRLGNVTPSWVARPGATYEPGTQMALLGGMAGESTGIYRNIVRDVVPYRGGYRFQVERQTPLTEARLSAKSGGTKAQLMERDLSGVRLARGGDPIQMLTNMKVLGGAIYEWYAAGGIPSLARDISSLPVEQLRQYGYRGGDVEKFVRGRTYAELGDLPMKAWWRTQAKSAIQEVIYPQVMTRENFEKFDPNVIRGARPIGQGLVRADVAYQAIVGNFAKLFSQEHPFRRPFFSWEEMQNIRRANPQEYERLESTGRAERQGYQQMINAALASTGEYASPAGTRALSREAAASIYAQAQSRARQEAGLGEEDFVSRGLVSGQLLNVLSESEYAGSPLSIGVSGQTPLVLPSPDVMRGMRAGGAWENEEVATSLRLATDLLGAYGSGAEGSELNELLASTRGEFRSLAESGSVGRRAIGTSIPYGGAVGDVAHMSLALRPNEAYIPRLMKEGRGLRRVVQAMRFPSQLMRSHERGGGVRLLSEEEAKYREMNTAVSQFSPEMIMAMAGDNDGDKFLAYIRGDAVIDKKGNMVDAQTGLVLGNYKTIERNALKAGAEGAASPWGELYGTLGSSIFKDTEAARVEVGLKLSQRNVSTEQELQGLFEQGSRLRGMIGRFYNPFRQVSPLIGGEAREAFESLWLTSHGMAQRPAPQIPGMDILHGLVSSKLISKKGGLLSGVFNPITEQFVNFSDIGFQTSDKYPAAGMSGAVQGAARALANLRSASTGERLLSPASYGLLFGGSREAASSIAQAYQRYHEGLSGGATGQQMLGLQAGLTKAVMEQGMPGRISFLERMKVFRESPLGMMLVPGWSQGAVERGAELGMSPSDAAKSMGLTEEFFQEGMNVRSIQEAFLTVLGRGSTPIRSRAEALKKTGIGQWLVNKLGGEGEAELDPRVESIRDVIRGVIDPSSFSKVPGSAGLLSGRVRIHGDEDTALGRYQARLGSGVLMSLSEKLFGRGAPKPWTGTVMHELGHGIQYAAPGSLGVIGKIAERLGSTPEGLERIKIWEETGRSRGKPGGVSIGGEVFASMFESLMSGKLTGMSERLSGVLGQGFLGGVAGDVSSLASQFLTPGARARVQSGLEGLFGGGGTTGGIGGGGGGTVASPADMGGDRRSQLRGIMDRMIRGVVGKRSPEEMARYSQSVLYSGKRSPLRGALTDFLSKLPPERRREAEEVYSEALKDYGIGYTPGGHHRYQELTGMTWKQAAASLDVGGARDPIEAGLDWDKYAEAPSPPPNVSIPQEQWAGMSIGERRTALNLNQPKYPVHTLPSGSPQAIARAQEATLRMAPEGVGETIRQLTSGEERSSGFIRFGGGKIFGMYDQELKVTEDHIKGLERLTGKLDEFSEIMGPTILSGEALNKAQLKYISMMEKEVEQARVADIARSKRGDAGILATAQGMIGGQLAPGLGMLGTASAQAGQQAWTNAVRAAQGLPPIGGGPGGAPPFRGQGLFTQMFGAPGQGGYGQGIAGIAARGLGRLTSGWELMRLRRMWQLTGAPVFNQYIPAAAEASLADWQAAIAVGGGGPGMAPTGVGGGLLAFQAQRQQSMIQAGRTGYAAYGAGFLPDLMEFGQQAQALYGPAAGVGLVGGGLLGTGFMAAGMPMGAAFTAALPATLGLAGLVGTAATINYAANRAEPTTENQLRWYEMAQEAQQPRAGWLQQRLGELNLGWRALAPTIGAMVNGEVGLTGDMRAWWGEQATGGFRAMRTPMADLNLADRTSALSTMALALRGQGGVWANYTEPQIMQMVQQAAPYVSGFEQMSTEEMLNNMPRLLQVMAETGRTPGAYQDIASQLRLGPTGAGQLVTQFGYMSLAQEAQARYRMGQWAPLAQAMGSEWGNAIARQAGSPFPAGGGGLAATLSAMSGIGGTGIFGGLLSRAGRAFGQAAGEVQGLGTALPEITVSNQSRLQQIAPILSQLEMFGMPINIPTEFNDQWVQQQWERTPMRTAQLGVANTLFGQGVDSTYALASATAAANIGGMAGLTGYQGFLQGDRNILNMIGMANQYGQFAPIGETGLQMNVGQMRDAITAGLEQWMAPQDLKVITDAMDNLNSLVDIEGRPMGEAMMYPGFAEGYQLPATMAGMQGRFDELTENIITGGRRYARRAREEETQGYEDFLYQQNLERLALQGTAQFGGTFTSARGDTLTTRGTFAIEKELRNLSRIWEDFTSDYNAQQQKLSYAQFMENWQVRAERLPQQFEWQRADLAFQGQQASIQFGWQMEDIQENLRFATGRDRRRLLRQQERAAVSYGMGMGRLEELGGRIDTRERWAQEDLEREKRHFEERFALQDDYQNRYRRYMQERRRLEDELQVIREFQARFNLQAAEEQLQRQREMQEQLRLINEAYNAVNDSLQDTAGKQQQIVQTVAWFANQFQANGDVRSAWDSFISHVVTTLNEAASDIFVPQPTP